MSIHAEVPVQVQVLLAELVTLIRLEVSAFVRMWAIRFKLSEIKPLRAEGLNPSVERTSRVNSLASSPFARCVQHPDIAGNLSVRENKPAADGGQLKLARR